MRQPIENLTTFDEFVDFLQAQPESIRYELYDGEIVQMPQPKGKHEEIVGFLVKIIIGECLRLKLNYFVPNKGLVRPEKKQSGYYPDVLLLNFTNLVNEPYWEDESIVSKSESIVFVIEVVSQCVARVPRVEATDEPVRVSTNWRDDYLKKLADYDEMGIQEYWIVDYYPYGTELMIGEGKLPTISIYTRNDQGNYQNKQFRRNDRIESLVFPELNLTAREIFTAQMNF
ncbi:Uma2 family endonuclease [Aetokthonos hydrillicola Thurmond2011]|jgi:Uma2 family endonuclease|uniref:Uma2 family endonuclease n=1 Tax=Aetokthonos hydrillicola Thurmond2011 TaxID=2712845 RepID=A0AAP5MB44_9CYAN|nr:Uma2 family endonuclease [Aetokthonos hydrillicola]MBO3457356.1 Uma2 family endonuclease [Aetokthonos hydrillicola CCALA 1050]MBW4583968.1 Uma2 family endonuclease [Aetokthonos hydrillicola CCALA 1050]MDR9898835.1 Uma2 family endonuclease [Aetokthonos hydrillicola Thurmond2011]